MNKLRYYREKSDLTQAELAKLTGVDQGNISRAEIGSYDFKGQIWTVIANALNCTVDELLGRK